MGKLARSTVAKYNASRSIRRPRTLCYAPETTLNFFADGKASACCASRTYSLGKYPEQSIEEIWNGARAAAQRKALKRNDLSLGCERCERNILAGNYAGTLAQNFDSAPRYAKGTGLRILEFETSNICNLECVMCNGYNSSSIRKNRDQLPPIPNPFDAGFVEQLRPFLPEIYEARFLGGEPFLIPMYLEIWDALIELNPGVQTVITTNGTVMNRRVRRVLDELKPGIVVSCDSMDAEAYESVRINAKMDKVLENIEIFREHAALHGTHFGLAVCPMPATWHTIPEIVEYGNARNVPVNFNTVTQPAHSSLASLDQRELDEAQAFLAADLADQRAKWPDPPWPQQANLAAYEGLVRQVAATVPDRGPAAPVPVLLRRR